jgi:hypothetical protein
MDDNLQEMDERLEFEYAEFLMAQPELMICNGDDLIRHLELGTYFENFMGVK